MPNTFLIQINPDCLDFLKQIPSQKLSERQVIFYNTLNELHNALTLLIKQDSFEFSSSQKKEISRGAFYALTKSLENHYLQHRKICLTDLQIMLKNEFNIHDERVVDFIIMCLVEPVYIPFSLDILVKTLLFTDYYSTNESGSTEDFKHILKAKLDPERGEILFSLTLPIKTTQTSSPVDKSYIGTTYIPFIFTEKGQLKSEPISIKINFNDKEEAYKFKNKVLTDFKAWVLQQEELDKINTRWPILDFCVISILLGLFLSLVGMVSLLALSFTPFSPLLLPPIYLGLALILTSLISSCMYLDRKKDKEKLQRPIYFLNSKLLPHTQTQPMQTTSFFIQPRLSPTVVENRLAHQP